MTDTHEDAATTGPEPHPKTSRRSFMAWTGAAVGGAALAGAVSSAAADGRLLDQLADKIAPDVDDEFGDSVILRRPADQILLNIAFFNARFDFTKSPPAVVRTFPNIGCSMSVEFGLLDSGAPMHVQEEAFPLRSSKPLPSQKNPPVKAPGATVPPGAPPVNARIAGASRLVFTLTDAQVTSGPSQLTLTTASLLNFVQLHLAVNANAVPPFTSRQSAPAGIGAPKEPSGFETAIELPYHLIISPPAVLSTGINLFDQRTIFTNATAVVTHDEWTELWHTRLAALVLTTIGEFEILEVNETDRDLRTVRAIWCTDSKFPTDLAANASDDTVSPDPLPFTAQLRYTDRYDLVRLTSDFTPQPGSDAVMPYGRDGFIPTPVTVERLMLSSLGGWLDCHGHWDLTDLTNPNKPKEKFFNTSLLQWRQRTVQGRDSYVRTVRKGYLFPWGHKASLVTVTEREFSIEPKSKAVGAYIREKTFIVVADPVKDYTGNEFVRHQGLKIPFTSVESITIITPDLAAPAKYVLGTDPNTGKAYEASEEIMFHPMLDSTTPYRFHMRGTDRAGALIDFHSEVLWVDDTVAYGQDTTAKDLLTKARAAWGTGPTVELHGQRVSLAAPKSPKTVAGDTQVVVSSFTLGVETPLPAFTSTNLSEASQPAFFPTLSSVDVRFPEAATASGNTVGATTMQYEAKHYIADGDAPGQATGFRTNKGGVFLERLSTKPRSGITFRADKAGGAITPNLGIDGFSREIGPVSSVDHTGAPDLDALTQGNFNPGTIFANVNAKLLGGIELSAILSNVQFGDDTDNSQALQLTSVEHLNPHRIVTTLDWHPTIQTGGPTVGTDTINIFIVPDGSSNDSMDLHAVIITDLDDPSQSTSTITGQIRNFTIDLFGDSGGSFFVQIPFDSLSFRAQTGKKTDVDVQIGSDGVQFQGPLSFVQDLANLLNFDGSGLVVDTSGSAITATLTLAIPTLAVGVFALENLAFDAGVAIPYNGQPVRFDFSFCSRENPFQLEIMIFTGGGFVGIGMGADGIELLEFSFDFGLGYSIDIGIASGQVSLVGGIYYEDEKQGVVDNVQLTAWVKASGGLSALGLVSISVELYLSLGYVDDGTTSHLTGTAELNISVHIIFFGFSVGFSIQEDFAGSADHPGATPHHVGSHSRTKAIAGAAADQGPPPSSRFGTSMPIDAWRQYCSSFALIGVGV